MIISWILLLKFPKKFKAHSLLSTCKTWMQFWTIHSLVTINAGVAHEELNPLAMTHRLKPPRSCCCRSSAAPRYLYPPISPPSAERDGDGRAPVNTGAKAACIPSARPYRGHSAAPHPSKSRKGGGSVCGDVLYFHQTVLLICFKETQRMHHINSFSTCS